MKSCTTSLHKRFVGSCETTHERVCGLGRGVSEHIGGDYPQTDPRFIGLMCKFEGHKSLTDGWKGDREGY